MSNNCENTLKESDDSCKLLVKFCDVFIFELYQLR